MLLKSLQTALCLCCFTVVIAQAPVQQDAVRKLYNALIDAENQGNMNKLKDIKQQAFIFLKNNKQLTPQQSGLLYTIVGQISQDESKYDSAVVYLEKAYPLCNTAFGGTSAEALLAKKCLSWAYGYTSKPDLERKLSLEMLDYYLKDKQKNSIEVADLYHTIGYNYTDAGNWQDGQRFYRMGIETMENFTPTTPQQSEAKLYNLGLIYNSLSLSCHDNNDFAAALYAARKSLYYRNITMPGSPQLAINWMITGRSLYQTEGNADTALFYLDKAISILEKKADNNTSMTGSDPWIKYNGYKAEILLKANRAPIAIATIQAVLDWVKKNQSLNEPSAGIIYDYTLLSAAYLQSNNAAKALQVIDEIKSKLPLTESANKPEGIKLNTQYAVALSNNKLWAKATDAFAATVQQTGISINQLQRVSYSIPATIPFEFLNVYAQAADNLVAQGLAMHKPPVLLPGINILRNVAAALTQRQTWYFEAGIDEGIGAQDFGVYNSLLNALYNAKGLMNETDRLRFAFEAIESSKANLLKYGLMEENYLTEVLPTAVNNERNNLKTKVYAAIKQVQQTGENNLQDTLIKRKAAYLQYLQQLRKNYKVTIHQRQQQIAVNDPLLTQYNGSIVNYYLGEYFLYTFVHQQGKLLFTRKEMLPQFYNYLTYITHRHDSKAFLNTAITDSLAFINHQLYNWLLSGIDLQGELLIIPHKQLSLISFEMLNPNDGKSGDYLITKCTVRYEPSAGMMQVPAMNHQQQPAAFFGGFASTNFNINEANHLLAKNGLDTISRSSNAVLDGTDREVKNIAGEMKGDVFTHATPADFLQHATQYQVLHIATHAFANEGINHQCHFLFESDTAGNNLVSDAEVAALPLHARMAVLSACNTGLGKMNSGEGMISLGRAFFVAGCPSVIMSLWTVNDESTATIMTAFYRHLQQGETKSQALRNAKLEYIQSQTNPAKRDPYYWAGFIVAGDNAPLQNSNHTVMWVTIVAAIILLFGSLYFYLRRRSSKSFT